MIRVHCCGEGCEISEPYLPRIAHPKGSATMMPMGGGNAGGMLGIGSIQLDAPLGWRSVIWAETEDEDKLGVKRLNDKVHKPHLHGGVAVPDDHTHYNIRRALLCAKCSISHVAIAVSEVMGELVEYKEGAMPGGYPPMGGMPILSGPGGGPYPFPGPGGDGGPGDGDGSG